jgi:hypothetical protein
MLRSPLPAAAAAVSAWARREVRVLFTKQKHSRSLNEVTFIKQDLAVAGLCFLSLSAWQYHNFLQ